MIKISSIQELHKLGGIINTSTVTKLFSSLTIKNDNEVFLKWIDIGEEKSIMKVKSINDLKLLIDILKRLQFDVEFFNLEKYLTSQISVDCCYDNKIFVRVDGKLKIECTDYYKFLPIGTSTFYVKDGGDTEMVIENVLEKYKITDRELEGVLYKLKNQTGDD